MNFFDTVFDSAGTLQLPDPPASDGLIVIVAGHSVPGDGGGGTFYWDPTSRSDDNRGTIIAGTSGRWLRARGDMRVLSVRWFGARGDGIVDDWRNIQTAINTVVAEGGGTVYFPANEGNKEYLITKSLVLPRSGSSLRLVGDGKHVSVIKGACTAPRDPVISFEMTRTGPDSDNYVFQDLHIRNSKRGGRCIEYLPVPTSLDEEVARPARLRYPVFRNMLIIAQRWDQAHQNADAVYLEHAHEIVMDNVQIDGGQIGLHLKSCSRGAFTRVYTEQKNAAPHTGVKLDGSSWMVFNDLRIQGAEKIGLLLDGESRQLQFNTLSFEGKNQDKLFHIANARSVTVINGSISGSRQSGTPAPTAYGLYIGRDSHHILMPGLTLGTMGVGPGPDSRMVYIENGALHIRLTDLHRRGTSPQEVEIESGTHGGDILVQYFADDASADRVTKSMGEVRNARRPSSSKNLRVDRRDTLLVSDPSGAGVRTIDGGYEGQRLVLVFSSNVRVETATAAYGNIRLAGNEDWGARENDVLNLVCVGGNSPGRWVETGRSLNN